MINDPFKLERFLISSYAHLRTLKLKAYFKRIEDLHFYGLPYEYESQSLTRIKGSQYLMHVFNFLTRYTESYSVDIDTLKAEKLELGIYDINNCYIEGEYMVLVKYNQPMAIFRSLQVIGEIEFDCKHERCKSIQLIRGRSAQQAGHSVYAVDKFACLYRIKWQDIKDGKYCKTLVKTNVKHFYVDGELGLAIVNMDDTLSLASNSKVNLKAKVDSEAKWTIVTSIAKYWIVCGDLESEGHTIMASISRQGYVRSILNLKLTSNGYINDKDGTEYSGIFTLHQAYIRGRRGIMLAIERDGCCHLMSVAYGRISKLQSIDSIVNVDMIEYESERIVLCVTVTRTKGEFIAGGFG